VTRQALLIALLLAAPAALAAPTEQPRRPMDSNERRICRTSDTIGTRLGRVVRCKTQAEWEQFTRESGQTVDRMQRFAAPCQPWSRC
jgi:hypothetical protein